MSCTSSYVLRKVQYYMLTLSFSFLFLLDLCINLHKYANMLRHRCKWNYEINGLLVATPLKAMAVLLLILVETWF